MRNRLSVIGVAGALVGLLIGPVSAAEKSIKEFPDDMKELASAWTEPIKSVAEEARRRDPISGLALGLLKGTFRTLQRTVKVFSPGQSERTDSREGSEKLLEYTF